MAAALDELIARSRVEALALPAWLGSPKHRALLEGAVPNIFGLQGWSVTWIAPGASSYSDAATKTIGIERLTSGLVPLPDDELAEYVALTLLHEGLHACYSTDSGVYKAKKQALDVAYHPAVEYLYQRIEDARVQRVAVAADASLEPHLLKFHDEGIRQRESDYRAKHRDEPWTGTPASQRDQLFIAIERRLFHPDEELVLHPAVDALLVKCERSISAVWTATTEASGSAAIVVIQEIVAANFPS